MAASRTRSNPLRPLSRHGVRHELGSGVFSLVSGLPSTTSAGGIPLLFGCFVSTVPLYDSPPSCIEDLWLIAFSSRPAHCPRGRLRGLPVLAHRVSLHAWGLRLRGAAPCSRYRKRALLPSVPSDAVGSPHYLISELNTQPTVTPVQRFKCSLTTALTWLGARVVRYSFPVRLFHSLLHAGLSRRYPDDRFWSSAGLGRPPKTLVCPGLPYGSGGICYFFPMLSRTRCAI